jgi:hypothetical protein
MGLLKYIVFFGALLVGVPLGTSLASKNEKFEKLIFFLMIFFTVETVTINFVSREFFRGTSRGFEVGLVDIAMLIIWQLIIRRKTVNNLPQKPPGSGLYFLFFFFCWISIFNSAPGYVVHSYFEIWKMLRMYAYFWVIYNYINSWQQIELLMKIIGIIIIYIGVIVLKQKYIDGRFQNPGPFPHQNSLVMYLIVFGSLVFAYLLNRRDVKLWYWLFVLAMAAISVVSTLSRAGMAFFVFSCAIVWFFSFTQGFTAKKVGITLLLLLVALAGFLRAMDSIMERFETAAEESAMTRVILAKTAVKMANDKVLGIGLNNFGVKVNPPYDYGSEIYPYLNDGKLPPEDYEEKNGLVETAYLSIAAETGWHNLLVYLLFLFYFLGMNYGNLRRLKNHQSQFVAIGLMGGLSGIYLESTLEWVLRQTNNFYQLMMMFALIAAMRKIYRHPEVMENV